MTHAKKPAKKPLPAALTPGNPGNSGGKKGRSGRKSNAWKRLWRTEVNKEAVLAAARAILKDPKHPHFKSVLQWASEQGYGKPTQEIAGELHTSLTIRLVEE